MRTIIKIQGKDGIATEAGEYIYWLIVGDLVWRITQDDEPANLWADLNSNPEFAAFLNLLSAVDRANIPGAVVHKMLNVFTGAFHRQAPENSKQFLVVCKNEDGYYLATRIVFTNAEKAEDYAKTIAQTRMPIVVGTVQPILEGIRA